MLGAAFECSRLFYMKNLNHKVNDVQLASMTVMNSFKTFLKVEWLFFITFKTEIKNVWIRKGTHSCVALMWPILIKGLRS